MEGEAFSDASIVTFLNANFLPIQGRSPLTPKTWDGSRPSRLGNPKQAIAVANVPAAHKESVRLSYRLLMKDWLYLVRELSLHF
jgi:hypothetical protein